LTQVEFVFDNVSMFFGFDAMRVALKQRPVDRLDLGAFETAGQRDRKSLHFKPEPSQEPLKQ
jgi:hypothetical protein